MMGVCIGVAMLPVRLLTSRMNPTLPTMQMSSATFVAGIILTLNARIDNGRVIQALAALRQKGEP